MPDKTEEEKPQLVQPPIPTGSVYEKFREPVPGTTAAAAAADPAAATAAAVSVEPGLQAAILKLLPQWRPLLQRVEALEAAEDKTKDESVHADRLNAFEQETKARLEDLANAYQETGKATDDLRARMDAMDTRINERLDALASVVAELQEELGNDDDDDQGTPPKEK